MGKQSFSLTSIIKSVSTSMKKHSPEILTGIGIAGMITTTVMAVRATPKALILLENARKDHIREIGGDVNDRLLVKDVIFTPIEVIQTTWKVYIPAAATGLLSVLCLIGASSANLRRNAALATAYTLSETALKEYRDKVVETIGEKKEQAVRDAVAKDKIDKNPVVSREIIITEKGNTLCYDPTSSRYFKSDIDMLEKAVNELNRDMLDEMYISLNDFYYAIGLANTSIGDDLGWHLNDGFINIGFSSQLASDGNPCLVLNYGVAPRYGYHNR